ncbi:kinetochor protein Mis14/NSL1 [Talaromyces islandicus]|uniref:Kinetochor protein Mis14/NSL1 n=1 Tax=Talaromyces islandicus TaxID=28573 RepID=A0A0U1LRJ2_TALIS|nr:kinetochor protein Mis14/NSL1 [Talaromyces islandicus]
MQAPHHRKVELQSNADLSYLYTNAIALSRQKLDQVYPPSANDDANEPDPVKTRVKELVEEFIHQTYTLASDSISINGVDLNASSSGRNLPFGSSFSAPETIEYEAYDGALASRVSSLYAQLESLTTSVAQLRREAPAKAAKMYADTLNNVLNEEDAEFESLVKQEQDDKSVIDVNPEWKLDIPLGSDAERERWQNGEMAEVYTDTLKTLLRLQGEYVEGDEQGSMEASRNALSTTIGKAERAGRAVEVVQKM